MWHRRFSFLAVVVLLTSDIPNAAASGFAQDPSARTAGRAGAGFAMADAPSAFALNPAAAGFLKYRRLEIGGRATVPFLGFEGETPFPGAGGKESLSHTPAVAPAIYYTHAISDRLAFGFGVGEPFAFEYRWAEPEAFTGRFLSQRSSLHSLSLTPVLAYKLADRLSLGVSLDVRRTTFRLDRHVAGIQPFTQLAVDAAALSTGSADTTKLSGAIGVIAKPSDVFSIGFSYRHMLKASLEGQATLDSIPTGNAQVDARFNLLYPGVLPYAVQIDLPARAGVGVAYEWSDWMVVADVEWTDWSSFGGGPVVFAGREDLSADLTGAWRDVFSMRVGVERDLNEAWRLRGGYAFSESPVARDSISPFAPELRRHVAAFGATWSSGAWRLDLANTMALHPARTTAGTSALRFDGRYGGLQNTFSVSVGFQY
jgi:long-chain fatty acid transport protein